MNTVTPLQHCRACGGDRLPVVFDLGLLYASAFISSPDAALQTAPLRIVRCDNCGLVQLADTVDLDSMYRQYNYQSGINRSMVAALKDVVDEALKVREIIPLDVVCDIASNDGTLLSFYPDGITTVGFDPALNLPKREEIDYFINDYFSASAFPFKVFKAKIVTSIAVFYDLPDPAQFVCDVKQIMAEDGVWIVQFTDLVSMLRLNAFDNICHEHLEYYSVIDIANLVTMEDMMIFRITENDVNGGSLRFFICRYGQHAEEQSVTNYLMRDLDYLQSEQGRPSAFKARIDQFGVMLRDWLKQTVYGEKKKVYGLAASTKGNTLLQYYGIDYHLLEKIADLNPDKFGKFTVGTVIPIISEAQALEEKPDAFVVLAWHFINFFLTALRPYLEQGGALVVPLPEPRIYRLNAENEVYSEPLMAEVAHGD